MNILTATILDRRFNVQLPGRWLAFAICIFLVPAEGQTDTLTKKLQAALNARGCAAGAIDGLWGGSTASALARFNAAAGLNMARPTSEAQLSQVTESLATCPEGTAPDNAVGWFDFKARRDALVAHPTYRTALCNKLQPGTMPASPIDVVGHGTTHTIFNNPSKFGGEIYFIDQNISGWLSTGEDAYLDGLKGWMLRSAKAGSLLNVVPDPDKYRYIDPLFDLRFLLKPAFLAYDLLRQTGSLKKQEDRLLRTWLETVVRASDKGGCEMANYCDNRDANHTTLHRGTTFMLWGTVSGNDRWVEKGIAHYEQALRALRSDGSNENDVRRQRESGTGGSRGLRKQNQIVGYMVMIAEMGERLGLDLYEKKVRGRDVFKAFEFLVRGLEDDAVVKKHTGASWHGRPFLRNGSHVDETVAWFELFASRFPEHDLTQRFAKIIGRRGTYKSPAYGGNLTCFAGKIGDGFY